MEPPTKRLDNEPEGARNLTIWVDLDKGHSSMLYSLAESEWLFNFGQLGICELTFLTRSI